MIDASGGLSFSPSNQQVNMLSRAIKKSPSTVRRCVKAIHGAIGRGGLADLPTFMADVADAPDIPLDEGVMTIDEWREERDQAMNEAVAKAVNFVDGRGDTRAAKGRLESNAGPLKGR